MPEKPVPRMASTTTCAPLSCSASSSGLGAISRDSGRSSCLARALASSAALRAGSAAISSASIGLTSVTGQPASASARAHTQPSPPLLPLPASTATQAGRGSRARTSSANAHPARSIRELSDVPSAAMACSRAITRFTSSTWLSLLPGAMLLFLEALMPSFKCSTITDHPPSHAPRLRGKVSASLRARVENADRRRESGGRGMRMGIRCQVLGMRRCTPRAILDLHGCRSGCEARRRPRLAG